MCVYIRIFTKPILCEFKMDFPDNQNTGELQELGEEKKDIIQLWNSKRYESMSELMFFLITNMWERQQRPRINEGQYSVEHSVQFYKMLRSLTAVTYFMIRWAELCTTSRMKKSNNIKPSETKWWHKAELKITINIHCQLKVKSKN